MHREQFSSDPSQMSWFWTNIGVGRGAVVGRGGPRGWGGGGGVYTCDTGSHFYARLCLLCSLSLRSKRSIHPTWRQTTRKQNINPKHNCFPCHYPCSVSDIISIPEKPSVGLQTVGKRPDDRNSVAYGGIRQQLATADSLKCVEKRQGKHIASP